MISIKLQCSLAQKPSVSPLAHIINSFICTYSFLKLILIYPQLSPPVTTPLCESDHLAQTTTHNFWALSLPCPIPILYALLCLERPLPHMYSPRPYSSIVNPLWLGNTPKSPQSAIISHFGGSRFHCVVLHKWHVSHWSYSDFSVLDFSNYLRIGHVFFY